MGLTPQKRYFIDTSIISVGIFCSFTIYTLTYFTTNIFGKAKFRKMLQLKVSERHKRNDRNPSNFLISDGKLIIKLFYIIIEKKGL